MGLNNKTYQYPYEKSDLKQRTAYDGSSNPTHIGYAYPGADEADPKWQIAKITYDVGGNPTGIDFANGSNDFVHIWDDGAGTDYSTYDYS